MLLRVISVVLLCAVSVKGQGHEDVDFDDKACGRRQIVPAAAAEGFLKDGFRSSAGEWPWHVALADRSANSDASDHQCGGTLVHRYLVVTAAHCVTLRSSRKLRAPGNIVVKVGRFDISQRFEEQGREHDVDRIVMHWDYKPLTYENDIAILKLKVSVIWTPYVQPVCLWERVNGKVLPNFLGTAGTVVGWGLTENDTMPSKLNKAQMSVLDIYDCLESDRPFTARSYCAGSANGTGVCDGDNGGGMYFESNGQWYLRGVVSFGNIVDMTRICDLKKYVRFTDVALYSEWIHQNVPRNKKGDSILGHPNVGLINQGDCGTNEYLFEYQEERKPVIQQYLWMAALRHPFQNHEYVPCNGVLINKNYILTTKCVDWVDDVSVTLGDFNTAQVRDCHPRNDDPYFCLDPVQTTTIAEYFQKDHLVLARLSIPAIIGRRDHIQAICLPISPEQRSRVYQKYTLTGWKESGQDSKLLQRAIVDLIPQKTCREEVDNVDYASEEEKNVTDAIICVRNLENPSRSPRCEDYQPGTAIQAIEKKSNRYFLYGIQTGISYCSKPERFIAVTEYLEWILDHMRP